jgi:hypothetical protein
MCDRCGRIFSENEPGWDSGNVGRKVTREDGTVNTVTRQFDQCGECSESSQTPSPITRQAISSGVKPEIVDEVSRRVRTNEAVNRVERREYVD